MKMVILDGSAANPGDLSWSVFEKFGEVICYDVTKKEELIERAKDAEILFTNKTAFTSEDFDNLPKLKYIGVLATGFNVVDLEAASRHGVVVTNVPEYATYATAQMAIALLLELSNKISLHSISVKNGDWIKSPQFCYWNAPLMELCGKTVAVVGMGKIGRRFALIANSLGMNVIGVPHTYKESIDIDGTKISCMKYEDAIKIADVISFHCPLTPETKNLISKEYIDNYKDGVLVINTARGPVANEHDVATALQSGKIGGYAADVISVEPMLEDNPLYKIIDNPNLILTPHIAWAPKETRMRLLEVAANTLSAFLDGKPVNQVN